MGAKLGRKAVQTNRADKPCRQTAVHRHTERLPALSVGHIGMKNALRPITATSGDSIF